MKIEMTDIRKNVQMVFFASLVEGSCFMIEDVLYAKITETNLKNGGYYNAVCLGNKEGCSFFLVNIEQETSVLPVDLGIKIEEDTE